MKRDSYNAIVMSSLPINTQRAVKNLVNAAADAQKVDEHGNWKFGAEFDRKGRGSALNWDLYAVGRDYHNKRILAVIQIRQWEKRRKNGFANIRKSYFLLGRNEDDTVFAHPVSANVIHRAIKDGANVLHRVQTWIFGYDYTKIIRHGDVALVPMPRAPHSDAIEATSLSIQPEDGTASHLLSASEIRQNGSTYALNPYLKHLPGTHPDVAADGWHKVVVGQRSSFYTFAAPTVD